MQAIGCANFLKTTSQNSSSKASKVDRSRYKPVVLSGEDHPRSGGSLESKDLMPACGEQDREGVSSTSIVRMPLIGSANPDRQGILRLRWRSHREPQLRSG